MLSSLLLASSLFHDLSGNWSNFHRASEHSHRLRSSYVKISSLQLRVAAFTYSCVEYEIADTFVHRDVRLLTYLVHVCARVHHVVLFVQLAMKRYVFTFDGCEPSCSPSRDSVVRSPRGETSFSSGMSRETSWMIGIIVFVSGSPM